MKNNIKFILMVLCGILCIEIHAQTSHWLFDANAYRYDMTAYVSLSVDGNVVTDYSDYEIAAIVDEECRGIASILKVVKDGTENTLGYLRIRSNHDTGEIISFKVFQKSTEQEQDVFNTSIVFHSQQIMGMPSTPMLLPIIDSSVPVSCDETEHEYDDVVTSPNYYKCKVCGHENESRKADALAVIKVMDLIAEIGDVTNIEYSEVYEYKIENARNAYEDLSEARKTLVLNIGNLTAAEKIYKALTPMLVDERIAIWKWLGKGKKDQIVIESNIKRAIGEIHSDVPGLSLEVDASTTSSGSFTTEFVGVRYAVLSAGSTIKVPIRRAGDLIFIDCPEGEDNTAYSVGKVSGQNVTDNGYKATLEDQANGFVLITANKTAHFYQIKVDQKPFKEALPMINLNSAGWASFTSLLKDYVLACPMGAKAYVATSFDSGNGNYGTVTLTEVKHFGYGQGVFINGERGAELFANIVDAESSYPDEDSHLTISCVKDMVVYKSANAYILATNNDTGESGFYHVNTKMTIPAGKAFFWAPGESSSKMLKITFADGEEATGIDCVLVNGEIETSKVFYNLSGQKVSKDYKGIVISNDGKKYVK